MPTPLAAVLAAVLALALGVLIGVVVANRKEAHGAANARTGLRAPEVLRLLEVLPQSYVLLDGEGEVVLASTKAYGLGLIRNERLQNPDLARLVSEARSDDEVARATLVLNRASDPTKTGTHLQLYAASMPDDAVLVLIEDTTEKVRLDNTRRDFVANISHELKTPIGAISLLSETIGTVADDPAAVRRFAARLEEENARLSSLVQDIIDLSRLQDADPFYDTELLSLDTVVAEAVNRSQTTAETHNVNVVSGGEPGLSVYGDRESLVTAVRNLLDNAIRYTRPHARVAVATVRGSGEDAGFVGVSVIDQGIGIPPEQQERIFERFYRGDAARSREKGGSGLGLAIVKHVIEDHGGHIALWSSVGDGSTFTVWLPEADGHKLVEGREPTDSPRPVDGRKHSESPQHANSEAE